MVVNQTDDFFGGGGPTPESESNSYPTSNYCSLRGRFVVSLASKTQKKHHMIITIWKSTSTPTNKNPNDDPYQSYQYLPFAYLEDVRIFPHLKICQGWRWQIDKELNDVGMWW